VSGQDAIGPSRLRFNEELRGYFQFGERDFRPAASAGRREGNPLRCLLNFHISDIGRFLGDPAHEIAVMGVVDCPSLGGRLRIEKGAFSLATKPAPIQHRMLYRLFFRDGCGHPVTLSGFKMVHDDPGFDLWSDTTTVYTRLFPGHVPAGSESTAQVVASGIVRLSPLALLRLMASVRFEAGSFAGRVHVLRRTGQLFTGRLWEVYGDRA
jgi:hypothetical protein